MAVKVQFEIGHTSKLRAKKTAEGFTHDWELYVKGVGKAEIPIFIEKVVFTLHASFAKPKRALKEPPYMIQESGYAGFILPIDIYFRNREEPKRVTFSYDLDLQQTGPPHHRFEVKKYIFENPSEEFRQKLIKGGGVPVAGVVSRPVHPVIKPSNNALAEIDSRTTMNNAEGSKQKQSGEAKKHKPPKHKEEGKTSTSFANLFGPPIKPNEPKQLNEKPVSRSENIFSIENFSKDKEYAEKNREKGDKTDMNKLAIQKAMLSKMKSGSGSNGKTEKSSESDKSKHKQHDKERNKRDKSDSLGGSSSSSLPLPKQAHSPMKSEGGAGGRSEDAKKDQIDNAKQSEKKSKKEKKDKDRKREGNDDKHFNIERHNSAERQSYDKLRANTSSPSQKASSTNDVRNNELIDKKIATHKEKKSSLQENTVKATNKEEKSHKYKKKVKSKDIEREKSHDKIKKSVKKSTSSKDISSGKSNYINETLVEATAKAPAVEYNARAYEKAQRKEKSNKTKSSNKTSNVEDIKKIDTSSMDNNVVEKTDKYENITAYQNNPQSNQSSSLSTGMQISEESSSSSFQETSAKYFSKKSRDVKEQKSATKGQAAEVTEREDKKRGFPAMNNENSMSAGKLNILEPPAKQIKHEPNTKSPECHTTNMSSPATTTFQRANMNNLPPDNINELQELHKKIISLQDDDLQQVVELIASTGCYEISTKTFDFDLCRLNQNIVQRLQELLAHNN